MDKRTISKIFLKRFLVLFIVIFILAGLFISYFLFNYTNRIIDHIGDVLNTEVELFNQTLDIGISDTLFLVDLIQYDSAVHKHDHSLKQILSYFAEHRAIYDQVRLIDASGKEKIRVNYRNNQLMVSPPSELQDKSGRDYYQDSIHLSAGQVYVSALDLNIEHEQIEQPLRPMIRFASPIVAPNNHRKGLVVLNYDATDLLKHLRDLAHQETGVMLLVNSKGYFVLGPTAADDWSELLPNRKQRSFAKMFPDIWKQMQEPQDRIIRTKEGIFFIKKPLKQNFSGITRLRGRIVWWLPWHEILPGNFYDYFIIFDFLFLMVLIASWFWSSASLRKLQYEQLLEKMATTDQLTKLSNRRYFVKTATRTLVEAEFSHRPVSLMMLDIDFFKNINDEYGHLKGDEALIQLAKACQEIVGEKDLVARFGGEEFMILLPNMVLDKARKIAEKLREKISKIQINTKSHSFNFTISVGVVERQGNEIKLEHFIKRVDDCLYQAKEQGRNRVISA